MEHNKHNYNLRRRDGIFKYAPFSGTERHRNSHPGHPIDIGSTDYHGALDLRTP
jgi:hypothetical protein